MKVKNDYELSWSVIIVLYYADDAKCPIQQDERNEKNKKHADLAKSSHVDDALQKSICDDTLSPAHFVFQNRHLGFFTPWPTISPPFSTVTLSPESSESGGVGNESERLESPSNPFSSS